MLAGRARGRTIIDTMSTNICRWHRDFGHLESDVVAVARELGADLDTTKATFRWAESERNQKLVADNANGKRFLGRGCSARVKPCCLDRCAVSGGKKLRVRYEHTYCYECVGAFNQLAAARCITFGGMRLDRALAKEVLDRLQPLGVEAALAAIEARGREERPPRIGLTASPL